jgi:hypothetical protein
MILASSTRYRMISGCLASVFSDFLGAFLAGAALTAFFAGAFLAAAFFAGAFFAGTFFGEGFSAGAFSTASFGKMSPSGSLLRVSPTEVAVPPKTALMTSDAAAIPKPTTNPALSTIVLSLIIRPIRVCVCTQSRIVDGLLRLRAVLLLTFHIVGSPVPGRDAAPSPQIPSTPLRCTAEWPLRSHVAAALHPALWHSPTIMKGKCHAVI